MTCVLDVSCAGGGDPVRVSADLFLCADLTDEREAARLRSEFMCGRLRHAARCQQQGAAVAVDLRAASGVGVTVATLGLLSRFQRFARQQRTDELWALRGEVLGGASATDDVLAAVAAADYLGMPAATRWFASLVAPSMHGQSAAALAHVAQLLRSRAANPALRVPAQELSRAAADHPDLRGASAALQLSAGLRSRGAGESVDAACALVVDLRARLDAATWLLRRGGRQRAAQRDFLHKLGVQVSVPVATDSVEGAQWAAVMAKAYPQGYTRADAARHGLLVPEGTAGEPGTVLVPLRLRTSMSANGMREVLRWGFGCVVNNAARAPFVRAYAAAQCHRVNEELWRGGDPWCCGPLGASLCDTVHLLPETFGGAPELRSVDGAEITSAGLPRALAAPPQRACVGVREACRASEAALGVGPASVGPTRPPAAAP